ncbi:MULTISPECIES: ATP-binding protein [Bacillota]|jgi:predicted AAA+ superfamily ATPase|uniref:ATP-binding protein n=2 Tax=Amedibacillus TaxID=2749846 RepID=A0A7G9GS85_9FIRM|nr:MULTISPECIES: AAA family ATPase [Bacillota]QNM13667.1 ATP-binding protein [[Eubacterium] hominis]MCH4283639.1 AAA family ATPase [Amedibacillus hominis]RGB54173.1 DUF4143 domain-containing protein [Absiella sp. AM10-20]RGB56616.1 DUF4143 domain-containing protein [Absiella sp. AM22-9]RGB64756.1 DUF4143 domain-containing protein [Absiella sp. AM09-45]
MMYRKFYEYMMQWKQDKNKKALYINGARQIGKTTLIREFGKKNYKKFLEINFITTPSAKTIFEGDLSADLLITKLTAYFKTELIPHDTLIFFDEIQECMEVRTAIKFLVEDRRFDYIESGSLLGVTYQNVKSLPVGYEDPHTMYPMDFEEFAIAMGIQQSTLNILKEAYINRKPVDDFIHKEMMKLFKFYCVVGGMPAVVQAFIQTKDMGKVINEQKGILELYRKDVQKYAEKGKDKIQMIFDAIPAELNNKNKRFILSDLKKSARSERYESCFNWLNDAGVTLPCYNLQELKQPVAINLSRNLFKLFLNDTGLLCAMSSSNIQYMIISDDLDVNEGSIMENMFATQLVSNGYKIYYYDKKKFGELDFVIESENKLQPIEIKSGNNYKKHPALNHVIEMKDDQMKKPIVFCIGNIEETEDLIYIPLYMVMFLTEPVSLGKIDFTLHI